jgi:hypothetical protein
LDPPLLFAAREEAAMLRGLTPPDIVDGRRRREWMRYRDHAKGAAHPPAGRLNTPAAI